MIRFRKYMLPFLLCFVCLVTFGGKGYDYVSDDMSLERIESSDHLKMLSGIIRILGEGANLHKKNIVSFGDRDLLPWNVSFFENPIQHTCKSVFSRKLVTSVNELPFISNPSLLIFICVLRI